MHLFCFSSKVIKFQVSRLSSSIMNRDHLVLRSGPEPKIMVCKKRLQSNTTNESSSDLLKTWPIIYSHQYSQFVSLDHPCLICKK